MPQILYKAINPAGEETAGFVEAPNAEAAVSRLKAQGLTGIELHESPDSAQRREGRAGLSEAQAAQLAAFELRIRTKPGLDTLLAEVARRTWIWVTADLAAVLIGLATDRPLLIFAGLFFLLLTFGWPAWQHRYSRYFQRLLQAMAVGDWDEAERMLARFRQKQHPESVAVSIEFYDAQIKVRKGAPLPAVLADLERMRWRVARSPGHFESRVASVHAAARDYAGFLAALRRGYEATPEDPSRRLDLALAEARLGDLQAAQDLLGGVNLDALPVHGRPFADWTRGLIELRQANPAAQATLMSGVAGFLKMSTPASLSSLALCSGACALAMARKGQLEDARRMTAQVWPFLLVYGDTLLMAEIKREIGAAPSTLAPERVSGTP